MSRYISDKLRLLVTERARNRCEYCLLPQADRIAKHQIDHILPYQHNGQTIAENLALAYSQCNKYKGTNIATYDLETGDLTPLFNPRTQIWTEHFQMEETGEIETLTVEARATARILQLNNLERIEARRILIEGGVY
jgi:hypothetical protein